MKPGDWNILLMRVSRTHRRRFQSEFSKIGLSAGQPRILEYLSQNDGCIQRKLSDDLKLEPATVTSVLSYMEKKGLIFRRSVDNDKRALSVWMSELGREKDKQAKELFIKLEQECFKGFSAGELDTAADIMKRMYHNMLEGEADDQTI